MSMGICEYFIVLRLYCPNMKLTFNSLLYLLPLVCAALYAKPDNNFSNKTQINFQQTIERIRLGHEGAEGFHRQLLLGFTNLATDGVDTGFDALMLDVFTTDAYWFLDNNSYTIQGLPFRADLLVDIGVVSAFDQLHTIMIDSLEGYTGEVWLIDTESGQTVDLKLGNAQFFVPAGTFNNRFKLAFSNTTLSLDGATQTEPQFRAFYLKSTASIWVESPDSPTLSIEIFDLSGRKIKSIETKIFAHVRQIPMKNYPVGIYLLRIKTRDKVYKNKILKF